MLWYRATILEVSANLDSVQVLYVDYGNTEFLQVTQLREIPVTFLMLPKQMIFVEIKELKSAVPSTRQTFYNKMQKMRVHWLIKLYVSKLEPNARGSSRNGNHEQLNSKPLAADAKSTRS